MWKQTNKKVEITDKINTKYLWSETELELFWIITFYLLLIYYIHYITYYIIFIIYILLIYYCFIIIIKLNLLLFNNCTHQKI